MVSFSKRQDWYGSSLRVMNGQLTDSFLLMILHEMHKISNAALLRSLHQGPKS